MGLSVLRGSGCVGVVVPCAQCYLPLWPFPCNPQPLCSIAHTPAPQSSCSRDGSCRDRIIPIYDLPAPSQYLRDTIVSSAHVRADFVTEDSGCTSSAALYCGTASKSSHQPRTAVHQAPVHGMGGSGPRAFACASRLKRRAHGYKYLQTSCYRRVSSTYETSFEN